MLSPMVWVMCLLLATLFIPDQRRKKRFIIASCFILYFCSNSFLVDECYRFYEPVTQDYDTNQVVYDGAIILGGLGDIDLRLKKLNFGYGGDRLLQALPLYFNGKVKKIIFTGGSGSLEFPEKREGIYVQKYLNSIRFPARDLLVESKSRNTHENAVNTRNMLDSMGMLQGKYLLVTSAFHMPRALAVFKKAGFTNIEPYITNKLSGVRRFTPDHLLIPNPAAMKALEFLFHEWLGYAVYKIQGYA